MLLSLLITMITFSSVFTLTISEVAGQTSQGEHHWYVGQPLPDRAPNTFTVNVEPKIENVNVRIAINIDFGYNYNVALQNISYVADWKDTAVVIYDIANDPNAQLHTLRVINYNYSVPEVPAGFHKIIFEAKGAGIYFDYNADTCHFFTIIGSATLNFAYDPQASTINPTANQTQKPTSSPTLTVTNDQSLSPTDTFPVPTQVLGSAPENQTFGIFAIGIVVITALLAVSILVFRRHRKTAMLNQQNFSHAMLPHSYVHQLKVSHSNGQFIEFTSAPALVPYG
jgi:hypothetical protein